MKWVSALSDFVFVDFAVSNVGVTPIQKKKMKLYKQTPQLSEVIAVTCQHKSVLHLKFSFLF